MTKYANLAGYDPKGRTRSQTQSKEVTKKTAPASFTTGFIYTHYRTVEYVPDKLMLPNMVVPAVPVNYEETMLNDCLTLSVNQLLRHQFFVQREQVQRLWKSSVSWS